MNDQELAQLARDTAKKTYAPYSNFRVGAALITDSGNVYTGCNIENVSYPATVWKTIALTQPKLGGDEKSFLEIEYCVHEFVGLPRDT